MKKKIYTVHDYITPNGFLPFLCEKKELPTIFKLNQKKILKYIQYENGIHVNDLIKNPSIIENHLILVPITESCKKIKLQKIVSESLYRLIKTYTENFKIVYIENERIM